MKEILSWYDGDNPDARTNLARIMNHEWRLAGTGRFVIPPVVQGVGAVMKIYSGELE